MAKECKNYDDICLNCCTEFTASQKTKRLTVLRNSEECGNEMLIGDAVFYVFGASINELASSFVDTEHLTHNLSSKKTKIVALCNSCASGFQKLFDSFSDFKILSHEKSPLWNFVNHKRDNILKSEFSTIYSEIHPKNIKQEVTAYVGDNDETDNQYQENTDSEHAMDYDACPADDFAQESFSIGLHGTQTKSDLHNCTDNILVESGETLLSINRKSKCISTPDESNSQKAIVDTQQDDKQLSFVTLLKKYPVLLNKSQLPKIKEAKKAASNNMLEELRITMGMEVDEKKLLKKIHNMKNHIKKKTTETTIGGRNKTALSDWENIFFQLWKPKQKSKAVSGSFKITSENKEDKQCTAVVLSSDTSTSKSKPFQFSRKQEKANKTAESVLESAETDETCLLSTVQLKRLVLLEHLKLIKMKQSRYCESLRNIK